MRLSAARALGLYLTGGDHASLIVDDSRFVRAICAACSKRRESSARKPPTARRHGAVEAEPIFDLALVDWNMPVMAGWRCSSSCARGLRRREGNDGDH